MTAPTITELGTMVTERIKAWYSVNKVLPANILFYRDGVCESHFHKGKTTQLPAVYEGATQALFELLQAKIPGLPRSYHPRVTFIITLLSQEPQRSRQL